MKNILLAIVFSLLISSGFAQNLSLSWHEGAILNGAIIDVSGKIDTVLYAEIHLHNDGASVIEVKVRKEDIYVVPGTMDTYCLGIQCYGGETPVSLHSIQIDPGLADSSFVGDYYPMGNEGTSVIRYTFFNVNDLDDTISVTVRYSGTVGIASSEIQPVLLSNAYPNPASDRVYFDHFQFTTANSRVLVIRDMAGRIVREVLIPAERGTIEIDISDIDSGIYFYSLLEGRKVMLTKKLVIKR